MCSCALCQRYPCTYLPGQAIILRIRDRHQGSLAHSLTHRIRTNATRPVYVIRPDSCCFFLSLSITIRMILFTSHCRRLCWVSASSSTSPGINLPVWLAFPPPFPVNAILLKSPQLLYAPHHDSFPLSLNYYAKLLQRASTRAVSPTQAPTNLLEQSLLLS